jgi:hypothetical protein
VQAHEVIEVLRRRYRDADGEWLFFTEAWRIDAYAVRCWAGGIGHRRVAMEVKVSRSDFLSEIRKPAKRANALDVSHEFYFVTPYALVRPDEVPDECGLMFVKDGRTKIAKRAPLRTPRPFKLSETIYLMRLPLYRNGILDLRRQVLHAQGVQEWYEERMGTQVQTLDRAQERLLDLGGHLIVKGSMWRGRWQPRSWIPAVEGVQAYVEEVKDRHVVLLRVDNGEVASYVSKVDLLTDYVPLDMRAVA